MQILLKKGLTNADSLLDCAHDDNTSNKIKGLCGLAASRLGAGHAAANHTRPL